MDLNEKLDQNDSTFEQMLEKLDHIVNKLEVGNATLDEAVNLFQTGIELSKRCHQKLSEVEENIAKVMNEDGSIVPFKIDE